MVLGAGIVAQAAGGAASAVGGASVATYRYNRDNFMYDRDMRLEVEYDNMNFRIKQAALWREDVRDMIGLTLVKMDTYLLISAVMLGFCVMAFCEGKLASGTPTWIVGCHTLALSGSFLYLGTAVWFTMHASVASRGYQAQLLTQFVRLPVPSWSQIEGARTYASSFEKTQAQQMFRVPFLFGTQEQVKHRGGLPVSPGTPSTGSPSVAAGLAGSRQLPAIDEKNAVGQSTGVSADPWGLERPGHDIFELDATVREDPQQLRHVMLVQEAMRYWQTYDAFARASLTMGMTQFITALSYYILGSVLITNRAVLAAWVSVAVLTLATLGLVANDMSMTASDFMSVALFACTGPAVSSAASFLWMKHGGHNAHLVKVLAPIPFVTHALLLAFLLSIVRSSQRKSGAVLPMAWRSVLYIDIFGWVNEIVRNPRLEDGIPNMASSGTHASVQCERSAPKSPQVQSGVGPAMQEIFFHRGQPVPLRPEDVPGASVSLLGAGESARRVEPSSFMPREKNFHLGLGGEGHRRDHSSIPWRIFLLSSIMLVVLWLVAACFVVLDSDGWNMLDVQPLLSESVDGEVSFAHMNMSVRERDFMARALRGLREPLALVDEVAEPRWLVGGQEIPTMWRHSGVRPENLACDSTRNTIVAMSRYGLFVGHLGGDVTFESAPQCDAVDGETLQDVSLLCPEGQGDSSTCHALVLHGEGRRLARCDLVENVHGALDLTSTTAARLVESWDAGPGEQRDQVRSLALSSNCQLAGRPCAFVETAKQSLVQWDSATPQGTGQWGPAHEWRSTSAAPKLGGSADPMHLIGERGLLAALRSNGQFLEVMDTQKGGAVVGQWGLPRDTAWQAMCAAGDHLFLVGNEQSPKLWRFPLPEEIVGTKHRAVSPAALDSGLDRLVQQHAAS